MQISSSPCTKTRAACAVLHGLMALKIGGQMSPWNSRGPWRWATQIGTFLTVLQLLRSQSTHVNTLRTLWKRGVVAQKIFSCELQWSNLIFGGIDQHSENGLFIMAHTKPAFRSDPVVMCWMVPNFLAAFSPGSAFGEHMQQTPRYPQQRCVDAFLRRDKAYIFRVLSNDLRVLQSFTAMIPLVDRRSSPIPLATTQCFAPVVCNHPRMAKNSWNHQPAWQLQTQEVCDSLFWCPGLHENTVICLKNVIEYSIHAPSSTCDGIERKAGKVLHFLLRFCQILGIRLDCCWMQLPLALKAGCWRGTVLGLQWSEESWGNGHQFTATKQVGLKPPINPFLCDQATAVRLLHLSLTVRWPAPSPGRRPGCYEASGKNLGRRNSALFSHRMGKAKAPAFLGSKLEQGFARHLGRQKDSNCPQQPKSVVEYGAKSVICNGEVSYEKDINSHRDWLMHCWLLKAGFSPLVYLVSNLGDVISGHTVIWAHRHWKSLLIHLQIVVNVTHCHIKASSQCVWHETKYGKDPSK